MAPLDLSDARTFSRIYDDHARSLYWGGLTADEIACRAGLPLGTVKSRIRLGMVKVRAELEGTAVAVA
jgi:Sigma-70, region 4